MVFFGGFLSSTGTGGPVGLQFLCSSCYGSVGQSTTGWLMPANVTFSTSYVTTAPMTTFISGIVNVFDYDIQPGILLTVGLYMSGAMVAMQTYNTSDYHFPQLAQIVASNSSSMAVFTNSLVGFTATVLGLTRPVPAGATVTVAIVTNHPIWVQIDGSAPVKSYETVAPPSDVLPANHGAISPYTIWVDIQSES